MEFNPVVLLGSALHMREIVNGALFVVCGNLALLLLYFMGVTWYQCRTTGEPWRKLEGIQTACVMSWIFGTIAMRSVLAWLSLKKANDGINFNPIFEQLASWTLIVSAIVLIIATLRGTYLWTPPSWHNKAWLLSVVATVAFLVASEFY